MIVSLFFVLEFVGIYFASYESLNALTELHQTIRTITEVRQLRTILSSELDLYRKSANTSLVPEEITVLKNANVQADGLFSESLSNSEKNPETHELIVTAKTMEDSLDPVISPILTGEKTDKTRLLILEQIFLETQDSLAKVQFVLADQSDQIFQRIYSSRFLPLTIGIALSIVFLFFVLWIGLGFRRKLETGVNNLVKATQQIADGDLDVQTPITDKDEIGLLTHAFNVMAHNLKDSTYSKTYVEGILQSLLNSLLVINQEGKILKVNRMTSEAFGYSESELLDLRIQNILPEISTMGGTAQTFESSGIGKNKIQFPVRISISQLDEKTIRVSNLRVVAVQDISESKKLENEIKERNHALNLANQELEAFSYSVSHDLRAPLRAIDGFSAAILEDAGDKLDEESKHHLSRIRFGVQRMGDLIDAVINLSKISRASMVITKVDVSSMVREILDDLRHLEPDRNVDVKIQDGLIADADPLLLKITMENLLGNAWKYTSKKANAQIEFGQTGQNSKIKIYYVKDDGAGFDMAYASKLFAPFQRLHAQADFAGTGVGLASVKRVVQRHGGTIWVESKPNVGTTFFFTLNS